MRIAPLLESLCDDLLHHRRLDDPDVELAVGQQQQAARNARGGFEQLVAAEHPSGSEVGRSAVGNRVDPRGGRLLVGDGLQAERWSAPVVKDHEAEEVVGRRFRTASFAASLAAASGRPAIEPLRSITAVNAMGRSRPPGAEPAVKRIIR